MDNDHYFSIISEHTDQTHGLGRKVGQLINGSLNLALIGQLGSGKTVFTKGLAVGLGISEKEPITSPTYTIINAYRGLFHIDLYRLNGVDDIEAAGVFELIDGPHICAVEWADRLDAADLEDYLKIEFSVIEDHRRKIKITAHGEDAVGILIGLKELKWDSSYKNMAEHR